MAHYFITPDGAEWLRDAELVDAEEFYSWPSYKRDAVDLLQEASEDGLPKIRGRASRAFRFLLDKELIELDERNTYEIVHDVSRHDRSLGRLLKVYVDIGRRKLVRDEDLDEALLIGLEKLSKKNYPEASTGLYRALRSQDKGDKIAALDRWVGIVHREGLLWGLGRRVSDSVSRDVAIILDRLAE